MWVRVPLQSLKKLYCEKRLVKSVTLLPSSLKSIDPIQKYQHIIESYASILNKFVIIKDLSINFLISLGVYSTPKLSK